MRCAQVQPCCPVLGPCDFVPVGEEELMEEKGMMALDDSHQEQAIA